jgi:hypothetical protein
MRVFFTLLILLIAYSAYAITKEEKVPGIVISHVDSDLRINIGSPSIVKLPNGSYLASHDIFGQVENPDNRKTHIFQSTNRGKSWKKIAVIDSQFWSNLFFHDGAVYLMGTNGQYGFCIIRKSMDDGYTWTDPVDEESGLLLADGEYHTAPMPMVVHNGRLWRAMEDRNPPENYHYS